MAVRGRPRRAARLLPCSRAAVPRVKRIDRGVKFRQRLTTPETSRSVRRDSSNPRATTAYVESLGAYPFLAYRLLRIRSMKCKLAVSPPLRRMAHHGDSLVDRARRVYVAHRADHGRSEFRQGQGPPADRESARRPTLRTRFPAARRTAARFPFEHLSLTISSTPADSGSRFSKASVTWLSACAVRMVIP